MNKVERARRIRAYLQEQGIKQTDIADKLNIHRATVSSVIAGRDKSQRVIDALCEAGVPEELLKDPGGNDIINHKHASPAGVPRYRRAASFV